MAIQKVSEFKEVTFQYQSNGLSTIQMYTDMPGGSLAIRLPQSAPNNVGITIPSSNNLRVPYTVPLDGIEGGEFYFKFTPSATTQLRLFSSSVKMRMIGVYLDGSIGEFWSTTPMALGA